MGRLPVHALWSVFDKKKIDGRTKIGRAINFLKASLIEHVGGESCVSVTQRLLVERIVSKALRCRMYEVGIFKNEPQGSRDHFLALENGLRLDLKELGWKGKPPEILDLNEYVRKKELEQVRKQGVQEASKKDGGED